MKWILIECSFTRPSIKMKCVVSTDTEAETITPCNRVLLVCSANDTDNIFLSSLVFMRERGVEGMFRGEMRSENVFSSSAHANE